MHTEVHSTIRVLYKEYPLNMKDVAQCSNVSRQRIQQLVPHIKHSGLATMIGPEWRFKPETLDWMKNREGRRK